MQESDDDYTPRAKRRRLRSLRNNNEPIQDEITTDIIDLTVDEIETEPGPSESQTSDEVATLGVFTVSKGHSKNSADSKFHQFVTSKALDLNANVGIRLRRLVRSVLVQYGTDFWLPGSIYEVFRDSVVCVNYAECLRSLDYFVDLTNVYSWQERYLAPAKLSATAVEVRAFFAQKVFSFLIGLRKHIYANQWDAVRQIMGSFDFNPLNSAGNNQWYYHILMVLYSFRWPQLYTVLLQWILLAKDEDDEKMKAVEELLETFQLTLISNVMITRNCYPLYVSMALVVAIAHEHLPTLQNLLNVKIRPKDNDPELHIVMTNYMYLAQFQLLTLNNTSIANYQWNNLFDGINKSIQNATEHHTRLYCLIEPLLTVGSLLRRESEAVETVTELCTIAPALLPFVCSIMVRLEYTSSIGGVISEVIENTPPPFLHQFPLIVHYIGHRTLLAKQNYHYEMVETHIKMLLEFLDHGRNRSKGEAWETLRIHLEAMAMIPKWLRQEWSDRASWWPRFHSKVDIGDFSRDRRKCLHFFKKNCSLDC
uniref:Ubiquitinyl hydrolase 1 n=1 Tax=Panagrellus redivivus TaxID=6233 RepID=A0A7E4UW26_PANRE